MRKLIIPLLLLLLGCNEKPKLKQIKHTTGRSGVDTNRVYKVNGTHVIIHTPDTLALTSILSAPVTYNSRTGIITINDSIVRKFTPNSTPFDSSQLKYNPETAHIPIDSNDVKGVSGIYDTTLYDTFPRYDNSDLWHRIDFINTPYIPTVSAPYPSPYMPSQLDTAGLTGMGWMTRFLNYYIVWDSIHRHRVASYWWVDTIPDITLPPAESWVDTVMFEKRLIEFKCEEVTMFIEGNPVQIRPISDTVRVGKDWFEIFGMHFKADSVKCVEMLYGCRDYYYYKDKIFFLYDHLQTGYAAYLSTGVIWDILYIFSQQPFIKREE